MSKSLKAVLLSTLVFPGMGHFSLKKHIQGGLLTGISLICLYSLVTTSVEIARKLSLQIQTGEIPLDPVMLNELVTQQLAETNDQLIYVSSYLLIICWVIGIIDSYRIGRLQDKFENTTTKQ